MKARRFDFYPDDWLAGTVGLDNAERGLYITACALIYSAGGPIPQEQLRAACRDHGHSFKRQLKRLLDLGKLSSNDGQISNKRASNELQIVVKRIANGAKKAAKRWNNNDADGELPLATAGALPSPRARISTISSSLRSEEYSDANASGGAGPPADPVKAIYDRGLVMLGGDNLRHRSLLGKMRKQYGDPVVLAAIINCEAADPSNSTEFFIRCCEKGGRNGRAGDAQRALDELADWARQEDDPQGFRGHHQTAG